jgi:hypothetical protein
MGLMVEGILCHYVLFTWALVGCTTRGNKMNFIILLSPVFTPVLCCLIEEHEGYTLRVLNNIVRPNESLTFCYGPLPWICYLSTNESWFFLCVHRWPQSFHHYEELALFSLCWLQSKPLTLQSGVL